MAKLVVAGKADCPHYAKAELLADYLQANLPDFRVHKITQHPDKWEWLHDICETNGWEHRESPIIWRELLDRGGKGQLLGGLNDFLQYAQRYYGVTSMMLSEEMLAIAEENLQAHLELEKEDEEIKSRIKPMQIWITSASVPICYHLIPLLANGEVFGMTTEISIHLLDTEQFKGILGSIVMEAQDMAFPLLRSISEHTKIDQAFNGADLIIVLDDVLLNLEVQSLESCIREVSEVCRVYAPLIEKNAKSEVKVISSGKTFVNLKATMLRTYGPSIRPENIIAIATSWESAAKAMLARKLSTSTAGVKDVIVWGNISGSNYIDLSHAKLYGYDCAIWGPPNFQRPLLNMIYDSEWIRREFPPALRSRLSRAPGVLPAHALATVLRYWYHGSPPQEIVSVGVLSEGQFCIPEGITFSMPVKFQNGNWEVLTELEINETTQKVLSRLSHELVQGRFIDMMLYNDGQFGKTDKHMVNFEAMNTLVQDYRVVFHMGNLNVRHCAVLDRDLVTLQMLNAICYISNGSRLAGQHLGTSRAHNLLTININPAYFVETIAQRLAPFQTKQRPSVAFRALKLRSVQSLCQLDLIDVSLIQHILSNEQSQREERISLNMQQISRVLRKLFQRARLEKPGQVDPRAAEFTLSLLVPMYDRSGTGYVKTRSAAAALISLSGDTLLAKYRAFFQFYAVPDGKETLITCSALRNLLTGLNQIPAIVGEGCTLSCVEIAIRECFHGVLNAAIVEEKFLSWLRSEPAVLLWLRTCYRLPTTEVVSHQAGCKVFPITGIRSLCLKCLCFDLCQACFFTGPLCKPRKRSHPVVEHCVQMSAKESAKHFLHTIRNNLFQEHCRRKEAQRRTALESVEERHFPARKNTFPPVEFSASSLPGPENVSFPVGTCVPESPGFIPEHRTVMQKSEKNNKTPEQGKTIAETIASLEADVLKMHKSIKSIHSDNRYMKKQFNKWKDKMQFLHNCQEEKNCKIEAKLQRLRVSHENLQMTLQHMKEEVKTMLQSSEHPSAQCYNTMPRNPHVLLERRMQSELNPVQIRPTPRTCAELKSLNPPKSVNRMQLLQTPAVAFTFSDNPLESVSLQNEKPFMGQHKKAKEKHTSPPKVTENSLSGMGNAALIPTAMQIPPDEKEVREELELLMMKLRDTLSLQTQPAHQAALHQEFFSTAEHVCRSFSDLINQVISPACK